MRPFVLCILIMAAGVLAAQPTVRLTDAAARKAAIEKPLPEFPAIGRQLHIFGGVEVEAIVGLDGTVEKVNILTGNPVFTKPVVEAVRKWRFAPFHVEGEPATAVALLRFEFK